LNSQLDRKNVQKGDKRTGEFRDMLNGNAKTASQSRLRVLRDGFRMNHQSQGK
jgi:hypothetical protein